MNIEDLKAELDLLISGAKADRRDAAFYKRILVQAVLTAGGTLPVDPTLSDAAKAFEGDLYFGNGIVSLEFKK